MEEKKKRQGLSELNKILMSPETKEAQDLYKRGFKQPDIRTIKKHEQRLRDKTKPSSK